MPVYSANVPITVEDDLLGILPFPERNTCDPAFYDVLSNRAWQEAQREITQTKNLIARPDSVLSLSCFNQFLNHQSFYAARNFPGDPDQSRGGFGGFFTDFVTGLDAVISGGFPNPDLLGGDPNQTNGYVMFGILEILVLDQLNQVNSITGRVADTPRLAACVLSGDSPGDKFTYLDDNFPDLFLGNRANNNGPYAQVATNFPNDVDDDRYNDNPDNVSALYNCDMMNRVWQRSKCYDFATESTAYTPSPIGGNHDGFYQIDDYVATAGAGSDYRRQAVLCPPPNDNFLTFPDADDIACHTQVHGIPAPPAVTVVAYELAGTAGLADPDPIRWDMAETGANPDIGAPGAAEDYLSQLGLLTGACSPPIQTGFVVTGANNSTYIHAICPESACTFDPPTSLAGTGSCEIAP